VRLVTAHDIAEARTRDLPVETPQDRDAKMLAYLHALREASREKARGEWNVPA
jgi:5'-deoxynucleotidase YfbR-like HD superfamily hydrolase